MEIFRLKHNTFTTRAGAIRGMATAPMALALSLALALLSGCASKPVAPPPPPPRPITVVIPPRPVPPAGAPADLAIPPLDLTGSRRTVNSGISTAQAVWNLRSAYNVAALNCLDVQYAPILDGYRRFLKVYARQLDAANRQADAGFRTQYAGREAIVQRETYQTQVYNFFALPPVSPGLCRAAMDVTADLQLVAPAQFEGWSPAGLAKMEAPFRAFFDSYDRYRAELSAWQARYETTAPLVYPTP